MRRFSTAVRALKELKSAVKVQNDPKKVSSFERNFPTPPRQKKIWEIQGISKDEFFGEKYKMKSPELKEKLEKKVERQRRARSSRIEHEFGPRKTKKAPFFIPRNSLNDYVFGTHSVKAALMSTKRGFFGSLYIQEGKENSAIDADILTLSKKFGLKVKRESKMTMNQLCQQGIHNGYILETKPIEFPEVKALGECEGETGEYKLSLVEHNTEYNENEVTTRKLQVQRNNLANDNKYPVGVYLDGNTDPQNVGAIIRSAYFLGVDFLVVPESESARLSAATSKASSGAIDFLPILKNGSGLKFFDKSKENGWSLISSVAPIQSYNASSKYPQIIRDKYISASDLSEVARAGPVLLILGSEGAGIRTNLLHKSDSVVSVQLNRTEGTATVDSLNVSVASALLISELVK